MAAGLANGFVPANSLYDSEGWTVIQSFIVTRGSVGFIELGEDIFSNRLTRICKFVGQFAFANERLEGPNQVSDKFNFLNRPFRRMKCIQMLRNQNKNKQNK